MRRSVNAIFADLTHTQPEARELVAASLRDGQIHIRRLRDSTTEGLPLAAAALREQERIYELLAELLALG